jgi:hypothetical protein
VPINAERNGRARAAFEQSLSTGRLYVLTGAGLSVWAGYGTWKQVIDRLAEMVRRHGRGEIDVDLLVRQNTNLLHCAQRLGRCLGNEAFGQFIRSEFGPPRGKTDEIVYRFFSLPFRHIITLNFEESAERACAEIGVACSSVSSTSRREMSIFLREMHNSDYHRRVVHLHGMTSDPPERIALTEQGYADLYDDHFFLNFLWSLATSNRLVFVGFGLKDPDFMGRFRENVRHLNEIREGGTFEDYCHFAIVGLRPGEDDEPRRFDLNDSYFIEPIFYNIRTNGEGEDHSEFIELINGIADTFGGQARALTPRPAPEPAEPLPLDPDEIRQAERISDRFVERVDPGGDDVQG